MTELREHQAAWGVPEAYALVDLGGPPIGPYDEGDPIPGLISAVVRAANWYHEQTASLHAMVRAGDHGAIRSWDRAALAEIGQETGDGTRESGEAYADEVISALRDLADAVEVRDA